MKAASLEIPGVPYVFCDVSVPKVQEMRAGGRHSLRPKVQSVAKSADPEVLLTFVSARIWIWRVGSSMSLRMASQHYL